MYTIVRRDLTPIQQAVQAAHATLEAGRSLISAAIEPPYLILLGVPDEATLLHWQARLTAAGIDHAAFREPDLGNSLTALATGQLPPTAKHHFRRLPLLVLG